MAWSFIVEIIGAHLRVSGWLLDTGSEPDAPRPFGMKDLQTERRGYRLPSRCYVCSGVPTPPVHAPPYSGVYFGDARNVFTNRWSRGSAGELTFSWNPQDDTTIGDASPGYGVRSMYREGAPSAEGSTVCLAANARSWSTSEAGSEGR